MSEEDKDTSQEEQVLAEGNNREGEEMRLPEGNLEQEVSESEESDASSSEDMSEGQPPTSLPQTQQKPEIQAQISSEQLPLSEQDESRQVQEPTAERDQKEQNHKSQALEQQNVQPERQSQVEEHGLQEHVQSSYPEQKEEEIPSVPEEQKEEESPELPGETEHEQKEENQEQSQKIESEALVNDDIEPETEEVKLQSSDGKEEPEPLFGEEQDEDEPLSSSQVEPQTGQSECQPEMEEEETNFHVEQCPAEEQQSQQIKEEQLEEEHNEEPHSEEQIEQAQPPQQAQPQPDINALQLEEMIENFKTANSITSQLEQNLSDPNIEDNFHLQLLSSKQQSIPEGEYEYQESHLESDYGGNVSESNQTNISENIAKIQAKTELIPRGQYEYEDLRMESDYCGNISQSNATFQGVDRVKTKTQSIVEHQYEIAPVEEFGSEIIANKSGKKIQQEGSELRFVGVQYEGESEKKMSMGKKKAKQSVQACSDKKSKGKKEIVEQSGLTAPKKLVMKSDLTPSKKQEEKEDKTVSHSMTRPNKIAQTPLVQEQSKIYTEKEAECSKIEGEVSVKSEIKGAKSSNSSKTPDISVKSDSLAPESVQDSGLSLKKECSSKVEIKKPEIDEKNSQKSSLKSSIVVVPPPNSPKSKKQAQKKVKNEEKDGESSEEEEDEDEKKESKVIQTQLKDKEKDAKQKSQVEEQVSEKSSLKQKKRKRVHHKKQKQPLPKADKPKHKQEKPKSDEEEEEGSDSQNEGPPSKSKRQSNAEQIPTNVSLSMQKTYIQHEVELPLELKPVLPPLTSQIIVGQAYKQRMGSTYNVFIKYLTNYTKALNYYKTIVQNISSEITRRKLSKNHLLNILCDYFQGYAKLNRNYHQKASNLQSNQFPGSKNPFGNMKLELKPGYQALLEMRKTTANQSHKIDVFVLNSTLKNIKNAFGKYFDVISSEEMRQFDRRVQHKIREKIMFKAVDMVEKTFKKGIEGKFKVDILTRLAHFVNEETTHQEYLKTYGKGVLPLRQTYITAERQLSDHLQQTLNEFKTESKLIYSVGKREFALIEDLTRTIKDQAKFQQLSPLTDIDYIRYVLQIHQKKEHKTFTSRHFESYLDLIFLTRLVGTIRDLYKGAICKTFPMSMEHEEVIHTISGNLVHFNRHTDQCLNTFSIRNINARILPEGTVEFDQFLKGVVFNDNRTVRLKLKDNDRAEELICYLNEKEEDFEVEQSQEPRQPSSARSSASRHR